MASFDTKERVALRNLCAALPVRIKMTPVNRATTIEMSVIKIVPSTDLLWESIAGWLGTGCCGVV
jgi:hypothetical protein